MSQRAWNDDAPLLDVGGPDSRGVTGMRQGYSPWAKPESLACAPNVSVRWLFPKSQGRTQPQLASPYALRRDRSPTLSFIPPVGRGGPQSIPRPPDARLGAAPSWGALSPAQRRLSVADLTQFVDPVGTTDPGHVDGRPPAAVLAPFYDSDDGATLILTRRAWHMRSHTGEVSFPGGRFEVGDADLQATALRESHEEIALDPTLVDVVGRLPQLVTVSSPAAIVPYVGVLAERPALVAEPSEVDGILEITIEELLDPSIYREEIWTRDGIDLEITFFELEGDTLWGATARMLRSLFDRMAAEV